MGDPARGARDGEQHREHGRREAHRLVNQPGIEIHVRVELALHEVVVFESDALAFQSDLQQRVLAHQVEHFVRDFLDDARPRVVVLVYTMTEAHQFGFAGFDALNELGNLLH